MGIFDRVYQSPLGDVKVRVCAPVSFGNYWEVTAEIDSADRTWTQTTGGVDSLQALILTLQRLRLTLAHQVVPEVGKLTFRGLDDLLLPPMATSEDTK